MSQKTTAETLGINRPVVSLWENRFKASGMEGLQEARRSGRKPSLSETVKAEIISDALRPPPGRTQWSTRKMAKAKGVSNQTVHKLWRANGIKTHIKRTFKISRTRSLKKSSGM